MTSDRRLGTADAVLAAFERAELDESASTGQLQVAVSVYVEQLKRAGLASEQVVVGVKDLLRELPKTRPAALHAPDPETRRLELLRQVVALCIAQYYRGFARSPAVPVLALRCFAVHGQPWQVSEANCPRVAWANESRRCLVFDGGEIVRRVWEFPSDWAALSDADLLDLSEREVVRRRA